MRLNPFLPRPAAWAEKYRSERPELWTRMQRLAPRVTRPEQGMHLIPPGTVLQNLLARPGSAKPRSENEQHALTMDSLVHSMLIGWSQAKAVYRFHDALLHELLHTPITGEIPTSILQRLPHGAIYVPLGQCIYPTREGLDVRGFFAGLYWYDRMRAPMLYQGLDLTDATRPGGDMYLPMLVPLEAGSLAENVRRLTEANEVHSDVVAAGEEIASPALSVLLYLCSANAEYAPRAPRIGGGGAVRPRAAAEVVSEWEVGLRLGAALVRGREEEEGIRQAEEVDGRTRPRPHIRRAHWHTYWTGPGRVYPRLRWLPPIPVAFAEETESTDLPTVVHPVEP